MNTRVSETNTSIPEQPKAPVGMSVSDCLRQGFPLPEDATSMQFWFKDKAAGALVSRTIDITHREIPVVG